MPRDRLYLMRHGQTPWNRRKVYRGRSQVPLSELGREQARSAGEHLAGLNIDRLLVSPLARATETARIVAPLLDLEPEDWGLLIDPDVGEWEGMEVTRVMEEYPEEFRVQSETPSRFRFPGGESIQEVADRTDRFLRQAAGMEGNVLAVTHNCLCQIMTVQVLGGSLDRMYHLAQDHCAITELKRGRRGMMLRTFNTNHYLAERTR
ncbi:MAG: histidine phosphatase family protein [Methanomassiliicoccales archaeon]